MSKAQTREAARKGGKARMKRLKEKLAAEGKTLSDYQRAIRARVSSASCAKNGALGAAVTMRKYGLEFLCKKSAKWREANPSAPERMVIGVLKALGVWFEREWQPFATRLYRVDFYLSTYNAVIEVEGGVHDETNAELFDPQGKRAKLCADKYERLQKFGYRLLVLKAEDLDPALLHDKISKFLKG